MITYIYRFLYVSKQYEIINKYVHLHLPYSNYVHQKYQAYMHTYPGFCTYLTSIWGSVLYSTLTLTMFQLCTPEVPGIYAYISRFLYLSSQYLRVYTRSCKFCLYHETPILILKSIKVLKRFIII